MDRRQDLNKVVEALGEAILPGRSKRSPLLRLDEIEEELEESRVESTLAHYDADLSSEEAMQRLPDQIRGSKLGEAHKGGFSKDGHMTTVHPRRRACAERSKRSKRYSRMGCCRHCKGRRACK